MPFGMAGVCRQPAYVATSGRVCPYQNKLVTPRALSATGLRINSSSLINEVGDRL